MSKMILLFVGAITLKNKQCLGIEAYLFFQGVCLSANFVGFSWVTKFFTRLSLCCCDLAY